MLEVAEIVCGISRIQCFFFFYVGVWELQIVVGRSGTQTLTNEAGEVTRYYVVGV